MNHNSYYWENKQKRAEMAKIHTDKMSKIYKNEIAQSIKKTVHYHVKDSMIYRGSTGLSFPDCATKHATFSVDETDTVNGAFKNYNGKTAILNFASYKNPGGMFLKGSRAQEESLCAESCLYNVLKEFEDSYYKPHYKTLNNGLYKHEALYSPDVVFEHNGEIKTIDVITCASPNYSCAKYKVSKERNNNVLRQRIRFVLNIAKQEKVDTLILGAFGCGVFQQDPEVVAQYFIEEAEKAFVNNIHIVFAVIPPLPNQTDNLTPFVNAVNKYNKKY